MVTRSALVGLLACALGCGPKAGTIPPTTISPLNPPPQAMSPRSMDSVQMFTLSAPPGAVEVYFIRVAGDEYDDAGRLYYARYAAAQLGCDGFVLRQTISDTRTVTGHTMTQGHVSGVCVMFPAHACPSCAPSPR